MHRMTTDLERLIPLLRVEMTAVHQQFIHMLALRQWKNKDLLRKITKVDSEDFKNAMQIVGLLVSRGVPIDLPSHQISPGWDIASILRAELRMEEGFAGVLEATQLTDPDAMARVSRAAAPRQAYRDWLIEQVADTTPSNPPPETNPALAEFFALLIALVEQAMIHASFLWHLGDHSRADNAWRLSGAAMLYGTALVRLGALADLVPTPSAVPAVRMAASPSAAFQADILLTRQCAELARSAAADAADQETHELCLRIAGECDLIAGMKTGQAFPATFGRSPVFESFAATRERYLA